MKFGLNFSPIPAIAVDISDDTLEDKDMITDDRGHVLIYRKDGIYFDLFTNDANEYISDTEIFNNTWRKL